MLNSRELPRIDASVGCLFFGGISLASAPCADTFASLLESERADRLTMIDPNIRPKFITNEERFRRRIVRMMERCDIVKVSDEDLHWLFPGDLPVQDKMLKILARGSLLVLVTRGSEGAIAVSSSGIEVTSPAVRTSVVDTVGAGDTFNAGFLAGLSRDGNLSRDAVSAISDASLESAIKMGSAAAAVTVSRAGADPPWEKEIG